MNLYKQQFAGESVSAATENARRVSILRDQQSAVTAILRGEHVEFSPSPMSAYRRRGFGRPISPKTDSGVMFEPRAVYLSSWSTAEVADDR